MIADECAFRSSCVWSVGGSCLGVRSVNKSKRFGFMDERSEVYKMYKTEGFKKL